MRLKEIAKTFFFIIFMVMLTVVLKDVIRVKFYIPSYDEDHTRTIQGFRKEGKNTIDVIVLGTSQVQRGFMPMQLYESFHIKSYNLATVEQPVQVSYHLMKYALSRQSPKVCIFDASYLYFDETSGVRWRWVIDELPFSMDKAEFAQDMSQYTNISFLYAISPLFDYHSRWKSLNKDDFQVWKIYHKIYHKGGNIKSGVIPTEISVDVMNQWADENSNFHGNFVEFIDNQKNEICDDGLAIYSPSILEENILYLEKMKKLCDESGVEFLVIKIPSAVRYPQQYFSAWTRYKSGQVRELCENLDITYYDMLYDCEVGIDWMLDTEDGGGHLNINGAEKATENLGNYLVNHYDIEEVEDIAWNNDLKIYHKILNLACLQMEQDYGRYLNLLKEKYSDKTIFFSTSNDMVIGLTDEEREAMRNLGLQADFSNYSYRNSYVAVIDNGKVAYEKMSNKSINYIYDMNGEKASLVSNGWNAGYGVEIIINGTSEIDVNASGINIVVYDKREKLVLDSVCFNTGLEIHNSVRNYNKINEYFDKFEARIIDQK